MANRVAVVHDGAEARDYLYRCGEFKTLEHNDFSRVEVQPSARLVFKPTENQTVWAAVSRAMRTPSESEGKEFGIVALGAPGVDPGGALYQPRRGQKLALEVNLTAAEKARIRISSKLLSVASVVKGKSK